MARYTSVMQGLKMFGAFFCAMLFPVSTYAASLYVNPSSGTYGPGDTFIAEVRVSTDGECINAGDITVVYPQDILKAVDFSRGDSIFSLFVQDPKIHNDIGAVTFSGGVPGGYCGRIPGDPVLSNVLGKIIFTVASAAASKAEVRMAESSLLYANDGQGTKIIPKLNAAVFTILPTAQLTKNLWLDSVRADTIPPESFVVQVESTKGIFGGKYYIVFSTLDKQSGLDHYEIYERGGWQNVTSPHELQRQTFLDNLQVRAIDKAGNMRIGLYSATSVPPSQAEGDLWPLYICMIVFVLALMAKIFLDRKKDSTTASTP